MTPRPTTTAGRAGEPPVLRIRSAADLVQAVPYLLGFHPVRSLVLIGLSGPRVVVTARLDLADLTEPGLLPHTLRGMRRGGAATFVAVVVDDDAVPAARGRGRAAPLPWSGLAAELVELAERHGGAVDDVVLVSNHRLWSYTCTLEACCPADGRRIEASSEIAAVATYAGMVALPDRGTLAGTLDPLPDAERRRLRPALESAQGDARVVAAAGGGARQDRSVVRALFAACRAWDVPGARPELPDGDVVRFGVALRRIAVRDSLWMGVDDGRIDGRELWRCLARRLPPPFDAPPLFLFGWGTYREGHGALAGMAVDRVLDSDPDYSAADLLGAALSQAVDPRSVPRLSSRRPA